MRLLMLDTCSIVATAAILDEEKLIAETIVNYQKKHSEKMMPAIDHMLKDAGIEIQEMDAFGIVTGPGSFTGLRIGMATVKGFAQALKKPVVGVSSLEALAYNLSYVQGVVCPILDAQRSQGYTALFRFDAEGNMTRELEDSVLTIDEIIGILSNYGDSNIYLVGDGVQRFYAAVKEAIPSVIRVKPHLAMNRASSAGQLALERAQLGEVLDYHDVEPQYIRPSYAEENRKK